ncbi:hypothetical protein [Methylobacterium sp. Gmos1]
MANVTYLGSEPTTWGGFTFAPNEPVPVDAEWLVAKARNSPFFSVEDADAEPEPEEDETIGEYEVKFRGRGGWSVLRGGELIEGGMTREAAEARARELSEQA